MNSSGNSHYLLILKNIHLSFFIFFKRCFFIGIIYVDVLDCGSINEIDSHDITFYNVVKFPYPDGTLILLHIDINHLTQPNSTQYIFQCFIRNLGRNPTWTLSMPSELSLPYNTDSPVHYKYNMVPQTSCFLHDIPLLLATVPSIQTMMPMGLCDWLGGCYWAVCIVMMLFW